MSVASRFDVAARLAEGAPAVDDIHTYVAACQRRGYQHPELTVHDTQVRDWYGTEGGLDLYALDTDCAALATAARAAREAAALARENSAELSRSWTGRGAETAADFLRRHCDTAESLSAGVDMAARQCERLRDELWRVVDRKVAATVAAVETARAYRATWLASARAVLAGSGTEGGEVIDAQVKPFVDNAIGVEWLREMRAAAGAADEAYRAAADALADRVPARFEVPGELGPRRMPAVAAPTEPVAERVTEPAPARVAEPAPARVAEPVAERTPSVPAPPAGVAPPAAGAWPGAAPDAMTPPQPAMQPNGMVPWTSPASMPGAGAPPGAMPDAGALPGAAMPGLGGLSTIPGRIADALTGALGAPTGPGGLDGAPNLDLPQHDPIDHAEPDDADHDAGHDAGHDDGADDVPAEEAAKDVPDDAAAPAEDQAASIDPPAETPYPAEAVQAPPAVERPLTQGDPPAEEVPATMSPPAPQQATPCEIAADELPHVGE